MKKLDKELTQFYKVYQSTKSFENFIKKKIKKKTTILDIGCGKGGTLSYYVKKYLDTKFIGIDYRKKNIDNAKKIFKKLNINKNIEFVQANILRKIKNKKLINPEGIISEKTFCTFKEIKTPILNLIKLKPKWIAINSLFYRGEVDVLIHIRETKSIYSMNYKDNDPDGDFNIFSINNLKRLLKNKNYKITKIHEFFPKEQIIINKKFRGTYTIKTEINKNTCFSGPVYLPWHFILIEKKNNI